VAVRDRDRLGRQCAKRHAKELQAAGGSRRALEAQVIGRFIECGDPHYGFARVYCDACRHDYLLAYSCKTRYFCPSCHQKRVLLYGEWVEANVLAPVAHRQYVFTVPKLLRSAFERQRARLGELCRIAARLLLDAYAQAAPGARPGLILFVQTEGELRATWPTSTRACMCSPPIVRYRGQTTPELDAVRSSFGSYALRLPGVPEKSGIDLAICFPACLLTPFVP